MATNWLGAGIGALGSIAGSALSARNEKKQADRNYERNKEMMALQLGNQKNLNLHGHELSYDMWKKTNYDAQVKQMKKAGLNPGLMYGTPGQGGTTQQSSGGSAQSGQTGSGTPININFGIDTNSLSKNKDLESSSKKKDEEAKTEKDTRKGKVEKLGKESDLLGSQKVLNETQMDKIDEEILKIFEETQNEKEKRNLMKAQRKNLLSQSNLNNLKSELAELDKRAGEQGFIKGNYISNILNGVFGLDMNNKDDRLIAQSIVGALIGSKVFGELTGSLGNILRGIKGFKSKKPKHRTSRTDRSDGSWSQTEHYDN